MKDFDLIIKNGLVFDGLGSEPTQCDIAITDGVIQAIGRDLGQAEQCIDAAGLAVTPGFIDVHTHYDGHVTWENYLEPSSFHGVTTAVIGNCGVGFAPCKASDRDTLIKLMDGVEDIPYPVLSAGLPWTWESYPDYLQFLEGRQFDMDVAGYMPHAALRVFVMGERAANCEVATPADIDEMCRLLGNALDAGAAGLATSRTLFHRSSDGKPIPTLDASNDELLALARVLKEKNKGIFQIVEDVHLPGKDVNFLREVAETAGRPLTFSMGTANEGPHLWPTLLEQIEQANNDGINIKGQVMPRAIGMMLGLELTLNPFYTTEGYREVAHLPIEERIVALRDPQRKTRILAEPLDPDPALVLGRMVRNFDYIFVLGENPDYEQPWEQSIAGRAKAQGISPEELAYDLLVTGDKGQVLYLAMANFAEGNLDSVGTLLAHKDIIPGLGDGGAHAATICDGSYSTYLLTHWGRDRTKAKMPMHYLVQQLTSAPAKLMGFSDRGAIAKGMKADLNLIDFNHLKVLAPEIRHDLPENGLRLIQGSEGYVATIVNGVVVRRNGEATGMLPGRLVRC